MHASDMPEIRFLADCMLGTLSKWLRILGYDAEYSRRPVNHELLQKAIAEDRQILTRNTRLRAGAVEDISRICTIQANETVLQLREVIARYHLTLSEHAHLTRCLVCNTRLVKTPPLLLDRLVPEYILTTRKIFLSCPRCRKVYWRGSHYHSMQERIKKTLMIE
jgi:hypothetical protein